MELHTVDGRLKPSGAFKLTATGYLWGASALFLPFFVLTAIFILLSGAPLAVNGEMVEGAGRLAAVAPILLAPLILAGQSIVMGGIIVFGLWLYERRKPIRVTDAGADT